MRNILSIAILVLLVACVPLEQARMPTGEVIKDTETLAPEIAELEEPLPPPETPAFQRSDEPTGNELYTIEGIEGELIQLRPEAVDPDGDKVTFTFSKPFDAEGRWQTMIGDEGKYTISVGATDGKTTTVESVRVIVGRANRPPVIDCRSVTVSEGENVDLHDACSISDEDDAEVIVTYSGWMGSWRYTTDYDDAGVHNVVITASDKRKGEILHTVIQDVTITVKNTNRAPVFSDSFPIVINAVEADVITLPQDMISDPDKDKVSVTFSEPFGTNGVWRTKIGDAGTYEVDVVASDGETSVKRRVTIKLGLLNTAPVLKRIPDITVKEGETVRIPVSATDREGDSLTIAFSGWMTEDTYKTTYSDAGSYTVKVTVSDGEFKAEQVVQITVEDVNRAPVFINPA
jgi:hypothetical protein